MIRLLKISALLLAALALAACDPPAGKTEGGTNLSDAERGIPAVPDDISPATMIAFAGHGAYFDHKLQEIRLDDKLVMEMQEDMTRLLLEDAAEKMEQNVLQQALEARKLALSGELQVADSLILQGAVNAALLARASERLTARLDWRHRLLVRRNGPYFATRDWRAVLIPRYRLIIELLEPWIFIPAKSDYVERCEADDVPIPPPWSMANNRTWKSHGGLNTKLVLSGFSADVFTWADPHQRGGCILLPRGQGSAGIICQSASTGKACFWDNYKRSDGSRIVWATDTLNVNQMQDGDVLAENCTDCHRGSNVFNISPDDTTWAKVIRPANRAVTPGNSFTTHVEGATRYTPISNQSTWSNPTSASAGVCSNCHELATVGFSAPPGMGASGPACATSATDPSACYN